MKKNVTAFVLFFTLLNILSAQDTYVKFNSDHKYGDKFPVFCFKGEILPYISSENKNKIKILVGKDTVELNKSSSHYNIYSNPNKTYFPDAKAFVKLKDNNLVFVDATSISLKDTVRLISDIGKETLMLAKTREAQIDKTKCGEIIRLIITNTPSIFYSVDNLEIYIYPVLDNDDDGIQNENDSCPEEKGILAYNGCPEKDNEGFFASIKLWHFLILTFILAAIGLLLWMFKFNGKVFSRATPVYVSYNGNGSLNDFAIQNKTDLNTLLNLNKKIIDQKYASYTNQEKKQIQDKLRGENLVIGLKSNKKDEPNTYLPENNFSANSDQKDQSNRNEPKSNSEPVPISSQLNTDNFTQQLKQLESNLLREIRSSNSKSNESSNEISKLNRQIEDIKVEKTKLDSEKRNLDSKITQIQTEKLELEKSLRNVNSEKDKIGSEFNQLQEKVINVDYLVGYAESVYAYLNLCAQVNNDAYELFYRLCKQNIQQSATVSHLLLKHQNSINSLSTGSWMQILQDIIESGLTNNRQIKSSFKQLENNEDKKKQFQRLLFSDILISYSSSILILTEAFRNLAHFQVSTELALEAENTFGKYVTELTNRVKSTGLENKYVPLFKNFENFLGQIESVDSLTSFAYSNIPGLEKGSIGEIVSYGVKTSFEETKTLVILT
jgi:hypothetical protein